ncbi:MAG: DegT/DnrJ/EryC1/StrS family aminotransferase [Chloroflexota bacterium]
MKVPFLDLPGQHRLLEDELVAVFRDALRTASFIGGAQVDGFEEEFARFCGTRHCVGVNSGTDALRFALMAAGIGPGDGVITVPNTFIATTEAISQTGAILIFVDVDERTGNMDPNKLEDLLKQRHALGAMRSAGTRHMGRGTRPPVSTPYTLQPTPRAVIPVHLYGQPSDMDPILEIAERYGLVVIEDACQAHGAEYMSKRKAQSAERIASPSFRSPLSPQHSVLSPDALSPCALRYAHGQWVRAGSMGLAAAFSFYPGKNLGACGEAGAVTTDDEALARKVRMLRDHGQAKKYFHDVEGYNGRLDAVQAGVLRVKMRRLPEWTERRRQAAAVYGELLSGLDGLVTPLEPEWARSVYHLYVVRVPRREELQEWLGEQGIGTGLHYPLPLHLQKAYERLGFGVGDFPVSEKMASEILSLPMFPEITREQQESVAHAIREFLGQKIA